ncbi:hypothetical protein CSA37_05905 [Candidatus Fermentibacteria bacterium]|nr:MAG: hypothetical protein CSA37_05905 [Candidatus Fermentibacteria bacterium]
MTNRDTWNRYAFYFNAEEGTVFPHDTREMNFYRKLRKEYSGSCLEIGAGSGRLARALLQDGTTFALEPSDSMIEQWSESCSSLALRIQGTGEKLPFSANSIQFVCFPYNGLQCVLSSSVRREILIEAFRVTAPGGVFVLEVSPVFGRRNGEPLTERYRCCLPDGRRLVLKERVERCEISGNIRYHMFYTTVDHQVEKMEEVVLELAPVDRSQLENDLTQAGFSRLTVWGDYNLAVYHEELSPRLLVKAEKVC